MQETDTILSEISHRPFAIPTGKWQYYQEWNNAIFLHWKIPFENLRECVPSKLIIDTFHGDCYVSLVAFTMQKIRPRNLPSVNFISNFHEINLRTYISNDNKKGVYFLNIESEKILSTYIARHLSGLPYDKSKIQRSENKYSSDNRIKNLHLDIEFEVKEKRLAKSDLDIWLTERYCLYLDDRGKIFRYDIHHKEWEIKGVEIKKLSLNYKVGDAKLSELKPDILHYSDGVKVVAWDKVRV